ncbi:MAG: outer membrane protein assembly factor BamE [Gammaproteobacteria bacterium]|jgi:outer membrane protein assembly factor BamE|nr:outer membrane protein assembly factor BamE [Pseudomonadota bacterium]MCZ6732589.1 outer membrane protein assembly factor BamE [Gammaproteobacteria bacterium]
MTKPLIGILSVLLTLWLVTACKGIYRPEVQQGNVVTQKMIDQLKIGMPRRQVRFILGTPLIEDPFHQDRWDYYYSRLSRNKGPERRILSVFFKGDALVEIRGDVAPSTVETEKGT